ncbi:type IV secretion system DNA-binding domain-containing protein [Planktomarina temperata]|nr:type IV secretion system DNA-binding domain-containing protein [Planktomarina temperata]
MSKASVKTQLMLGREGVGGAFACMDQDQRRRHLYTVGSTGAGKTTFLQSLILQDIHLGRGVCVIDPHGDMAEEIANCIPRHRMNDVIYFDAGDREHPIGFNPLSGWENDDQRELVASQIVSTFKGLWRDSWGEWLEYLLKNTLLALLERRGVAVSLLSIPRMLEDPEYREHILAGVRDPVVKGFWQDYFGGFGSREQHERISSTLNKAGKFVLSPVLRNILGQKKSGFDMTRVMDDGKILIVNLAKGKIGEDNANFLGSLIVSDIVGRAMQRAHRPEASRRDFHLFIDEFQSLTTDSFATIVSEARKYRLNLAISHQNFDQISPKVLAAILKNTGTLAAFRVNFEDAQKLALSFRPVLAGALSESQTGEFWCQMNGKVRQMQSIAPWEQDILRRGSLDRVRRNSRERFGTIKHKIAAEFQRWWH